MQRSGRRIWVLILLGLGSAGFWTTAQGSNPIRAQTFSHAKHVPSEWLWSTEQPRDCRGCHDYRNADPALRPRPEAACAACHTFGTRRFDGVSSVDPAAEASRGFDHNAHLAADCQSCHLPVDANGLVVGEIPDRLPIPRTDGSALCASCHDPNQGHAAAGSAIASFNDSLTARLRARPPQGQARFSHEAHIPVAERDDPSRCLTCHAGIAAADALYLAESQIDARHCASCHATAFEFSAVERESATAATFLHKKHLRGQTLNQSAKLDEQRCFACHEHDPLAGGYRLKGAFRADAYRACMECHDGTEAGGGRNRSVPQHGELGLCSECHSLSPDALTSLGMTDVTWWQETRPRVDVERPTIDAFQFGATHHDFVTGSDEPPNDCLQCHRVRPESRPSRASGQPFDHASHLPADTEAWSVQSCLRCHAEVAKSPSPQRLTGELTADGGRLTFGRSECLDCHRAAALELLTTAASRSVIDFSHQDHYARQHAGEPITCLTCHAESDGRRIGLRPTAADCTLCHTHSRKETTHDFSSEDVGKCVDCHRIGVPQPRVAARVERKRVSGRGPGDPSHSGAAFEVGCGDCHLNLAGATSLAWGTRPEREHAVQSATLFKMHSGANPTLPRGNFYLNQGEHRSFCIDCHWADNFTQRNKQSQWKKEPYAVDGLTTSEIRERYGAQLESFPGRMSFGNDDPLAR